MAALLHPALLLACIAGLSAAAAWTMARSRLLIDRPNARSSHKAPTPRGGGLGIVLATLLGAVAWEAAFGQAVSAAPGFGGFLLGGMIVALAGFADDMRPLPALAKFGLQFLGAGLALAAGLSVEAVWVPGLGAIALGPTLGAALTLLWIVGLTNAFNFMDGLDGLAGGTAAVAGGFVAIAALAAGAAPIAALAAILAASSLGFLALNWPPARVFMGDVGSQFAGFAFAVLALMLSHSGGPGPLQWAVPLVLLHFIADTALTAVRRALRGENVLAAHRSHLYQLLQRSGWSHGAVSAVQAGLAAAGGAAALWLLAGPEGTRALAIVAALAIEAAYVAAVLRRAAPLGLR